MSATIVVVVGIIWLSAFIIGVTVFDELAIVSADGIGWTFSSEVTAVKEFTDWVGDVLWTIVVLVTGINVDCSSVAAVGAIVTICNVAPATVDGTTVVSAPVGGSVVIASVNIVVVMSGTFPAFTVFVGSVVKPIVDVGSSVIPDESSMLTVTFASCSILDRSKP